MNKVIDLGRRYTIDVVYGDGGDGDGRHLDTAAGRVGYLLSQARVSFKVCTPRCCVGMQASGME